MTVYGFRHLSRLRESNSRIHRLSADVDSYERNKFYLKELEEEYSQLQAQLAEVRHRWNTLYLPALERRHRLLQELDFARNHTETYYAKMGESVQETNMDELRSQIASLQRPRLQEVRASPDSVAEQDSLHCSCGSTETGQCWEPVAEHSSGGLKKLDPSKRHYRSWNLSDAAKRVDELETVRSQIKREMGSIGAQTCALTVNLRKVEKEIASLRHAMEVPPEHLYTALEHELSHYKLEALRRLIRDRDQPQAPHHARQHTPPHHAPHHAPPHHASSHASQNTPRLGSEITMASSNAPSLAYSIGTISTDASSFGLDFLKTTESSLCEIEARFL